MSDDKKTMLHLAEDIGQVISRILLEAPQLWGDLDCENSIPSIIDSLSSYKSSDIGLVVAGLNENAESDVARLIAKFIEVCLLGSQDFDTEIVGRGSVYRNLNKCLERVTKLSSKRKDEVRFLMKYGKKGCNAKRIAFVVSRLPVASNKRFPHLSLLSNLCEKINDLGGYRVKVFIHGGYHKVKNTYVPLEVAYFKHMREVFHDEVGIYVAGRNGNNILNEIGAFNPNAIFYLGGIFEAKFVRRFLYDYFPTCFLFFNLHNLIDDRIDIAISNNIVDVKHKRKSVVNRELKIPVKIFPKKIRYPISKVKTSPEEIIISSALTHNRMELVFSAYSEEQWGYFLALFSNHPNLRLKLLGPDDPEKLLRASENIKLLYESGKIEIISFEEELRSYLEHCDLFVAFPGFTGGGTGGVCARLEKCPVICFKGSDVCLKELPELVEYDESSFYKNLNGLISSKEQRALRSEVQYKYMIDNFININKENFDGLVEESQKIFKSRKNLNKEAL